MPPKPPRVFRVPAPADELQANCCKNPHCENFGIPAKVTAVRGKKPVDRDRYSLTGGKSSIISLTCKACNTSSAVKSNLGIREEYLRLKADACGQIALQCPDPDCASAFSPPRLRPHGKTPSGSQRYRCLVCGITFTPGVRHRTQRRPELDEFIFRLLVNKMPMRRICETAEIPASTLYSKIQYLADRTRAFSAAMERPLWERTLPIKRLYISADKQEYVFNWGSQMDRRNVRLSAMGSVDNVSGYALAMHLNFDPTLDAEEIEALAKAQGDYDQPPPFRRYARIWLQKDYLLSKEAADITPELAELPPADTKRPPRGVQVKTDYHMFGHFLFLQDLCAHVEKVRFFLDRDPGLASACLFANRDRVMNGTVDVFSVAIGKVMTIEQKKTKKSVAERLVRRYLEAHPGLDEGQAKYEILQEMLSPYVVTNSLHQEWVKYPFPDMGEPEKAILMHTDFAPYDLGHLARLYGTVSLRGVDKFFMQVRRRLSIFERPIHTSNNQSRTWHGYSGYNPAVGMQLLTLFRVFYNYALPGEDKRTPAMRLGLAERPFTLAELLQ